MAVFAGRGDVWVIHLRKYIFTFESSLLLGLFHWEEETQLKNRIFINLSTIFDRFNASKEIISYLRYSI